MTHIPPVFTLLVDAKNLLMKRWEFFAALTAIPALIIFFSQLIKMSGAPSIGGLVALIGIFFMIAVNIAIIFGLKDEKLKDWRKALTMSYPLFVSYLWASILVGIVTFIGFVLLVLPGIYLSVIYMFFTFALVLEGKRGFDAARRSQELVRGYWWAVFGRGLAFALIVGIFIMLIAIVFSGVRGTLFESVLGLVLTVILLPLSMAYNYLIYKALTQMKRTKK